MSYLDNVLNDILSEEKGFTTTPVSSKNPVNELFYHVNHMNEDQLGQLENQIRLRRERIEHLKEEQRNQNPYSFPDEVDNY